MDLWTPLDWTSPAGLGWYHAKTNLLSGPNDIQVADPANDIRATLLCSECSDDYQKLNPCQFNGTCMADGNCECLLGTKGSMCESPGIGNGRCDPYFNTREYDYDNGDCCESMCVSTSDFMCGSGTSSYVFLGYPFCHLPPDQWIPQGEQIAGTPSIDHEYAGSGFSVSLTGTGVMVVSEIANGIAVYDRDGSQWIKRGHLPPPPLTVSAITASMKNYFGTRIRAGSPPSVRSNPLFWPYIRLCALQQQQELNLESLKLVDDYTASSKSNLYCYYCRTRGCSAYSPFGGSTNTTSTSLFLPDASLFDVSGDAQRLAVIVRNSTSATEDKIELYSLDKSILLSSLNNVSGHLLDVALSDDGSTLTVLVVNNVLLVRVYAVSKDHNIIPVGEEPIVVSDETDPGIGMSEFALSGDGSTLAIASCSITNPQIHCFVWHGGTNEWIRQTSPTFPSGGLSCQDDNLASSRSSLALSKDGSILAIAGSKKIQQRYFPTTLHYWQGGAWLSEEEKFPGGESASVALSGDGSMFASGRPYGGSNEAGVTSVYSRPIKQECGTSSDSWLRLSLTYDHHGYQNYWRVVNYRTREIVIKDEDYFASDDLNFATVVREVCLEAVDKNCYVFTVLDSYGDGMEAPGEYGLALDGTQIDTKPFGDGHHREVMIGNCSSLVINKGECLDDEETPVRISVALSDVPQDTTWNLVVISKDGDERILEQGGPYSEDDAFHTMEEEYCLDIVNNCFAWTIFSTSNIGFPFSELMTLFVGGVPVTNNLTMAGNDHFRRVYFGQHCSR